MSVPSHKWRGMRDLSRDHTERMVASLDRKRLGARQLGRRRELRAEAFSIRRLEGSRWRLRRTRQLWGLKAALVLASPMVALPTVSETVDAAFGTERKRASDARHYVGG